MLYLKLYCYTNVNLKKNHYIYKINKNFDFLSNLYQNQRDFPVFNK